MTTGPATVECKLTMPNMAHLYDHIITNADAARVAGMAQPGVGTGRTVAICGAGPTLATARITPRADQVWACNSALPYLMDRGDRVTHGFGIDQGEAMLHAREWGRTFDVGYYLASSVHPSLVRHLSGRSLTFFHSYLGIPDPPEWVSPREPMAYEMFLYRSLYAESVQVGHGLNSVPRAICLALFMGFKRIIVYGADCACAVDSPAMPELLTPAYVAWMESLQLYADGRCASVFGVEAVMAEAVIDGHRWHTRPDMVISARHMVELTRAYPGRIRLVGDTLPTVLSRQSSEFMTRMPALTGVGQVSGFGNAALLEAVA